MCLEKFSLKIKNLRFNYNNIPLINHKSINSPFVLFSNFHVLEEDVAYFRKVFNNSYNANEFYLKDIHGLYNALMEDMSFM